MWVDTTVHRLAVWVCLIWIPLSDGFCQGGADVVPPVRPGDRIEVNWATKWYPATVVSYAAGRITAEYQWAGVSKTGEFGLDKARFPDGQGHWMVWKDKSGKFSIEARYQSRSEDKVTLIKGDGSSVAIPIDMLATDLRKQVLSVPVTGNENMVDGANPVRLGDNVEIEYFGKWYPAVVTKVLPGAVDVKYKYGSFDREGQFELAEVRFPNGEGRWRKWSDASGKFEVVARYISRTADKVTIRKEDGSEVEIPIDQLAAPLRALLAKTPITGQENMIEGANPIRVDDQIQVKYWFQWYDAVVTQVLPGEVEAKFERYGRELNERIKLTDVRFPNGEGHWRLWTDSSGEFSLTARYIGRDETHVTVRREDGSDLRVEIAKLNAKLRRLLAETPIITPRPRNFEFKPPQRTFAVSKDAPALRTVTIPVSSIQTPEMASGGTGFAIGKCDSISKVIPIGGQSQLVAVGAFTRGSSRSGGETRLYWASPKNKSVLEGPAFLDDERMVDYSPDQSRLLQVQVGGYWDQPVRFCTYRIGTGEKTARAEASWAIPESKGSFGRLSKYMARLIGTHRLLLGNGESVSLYDFKTREIVYEITLVNDGRFYLHPGGQHFAVMDHVGGIALFEIETGKQLGYRPGTRTYGCGVGFSQDGRYLLGVDSSAITVWNLEQGGQPKKLRLGGLSVGPATRISLLTGGWISAGSQIYSTGLKLVVWNYVGSGVSIGDQKMLDRQLLVGATARLGGVPHALVGAATVPHSDAIELMKQIDPESIVMLKRGVGVNISTSGNSQISQGLRRAAAMRGFREDASSPIILSGSAGPGESVTRTYQTTAFGFGGGDRGTQEHTVTPWIQKIEIRYQDKFAWSVQHGGVPSFVSFREGESTLGAELQKSSQASYDLFQNVELPEELLYPRYQRGLGTTSITLNGFVDRAH